MDKNILKKIAKRYVKTAIEQLEAEVIFHETGLESEEIEFIQDEFYKIAERITDEDSALDVNQLVEQYYKFD